MVQEVQVGRHFQKAELSRKIFGRFHSVGYEGFVPEKLEIREKLEPFYRSIQP